MHAFNNLSRYAPEFVNTKEKKIESFKRGLGTKLMKTMATSRCATYNEFVSDALTQENHNSLHAVAKAISEPLRQVHPSRRLLWQLGLGIIHLCPSLGHHRRRHSLINSIRCIIGLSLLHYPREVRGKEA